MDEWFQPVHETKNGCRFNSVGCTVPLYNVAYGVFHKISIHCGACDMHMTTPRSHECVYWRQLVEE